VSDIDGLKIFKFYEHPKIREQIEVMKTEFMRYQALADSIKSFEERKHSKGKDTFDLSDWWKSNSATLPGFTYVLCAVLTNSPNSCPSERLCSIFHASYNEDLAISLSLHRHPFVCVLFSSRFTCYNNKRYKRIRRGHTPTTLNYRCSHSLTNDPCSSIVSR
jgi:hypothetical protein